MFGPRSHRPRLLVAGDLMLDHYLLGCAERISPEAPVPVVEISEERVGLGGAGNVVQNLLALGADVQMVSVVGDDASGRETLAILDQEGVSTRGILVVPGRLTPRKSRVVAARQQIVRFDWESHGPIDSATENTLLRAIHALEQPIDVVLLSDYNKGTLTPPVTQALIQWANRRSLPVLVDPKGTDCRKYRGATLVTPNRKEAAALADIRIDSQSALRDAGEKLRQNLGAPYVLITLSEEGMALFDESTMTRIPALAREVYDVTGAGDTVLATLGFALGSGWPVVEAARLANSAAAVVVGKSGSATTTIDEILHFDAWSSPLRATLAIQSPSSIEGIARQIREQGKTLVFTNGCFDLLHRGHIEYLEASRECGDRLIVGINSDQSVQRLKGPGRPIVDEHDRAHLLAALRCVDYVVIFDEDTPYELIRRIKPHLLTKGADYAGKEIVGRDLVSEVRLIRLVEGRSTSHTIDRIRRAA